MNKLRKGDQIVVIAGRDKGKRGTIERRVNDAYVVIGGINMVTKHVKPNPMRGTTGGRVQQAMPIHQSNVAIFNAESGKADRVRVKVQDDGSRVRVYRSSGAEIKLV